MHQLTVNATEERIVTSVIHESFYRLRLLYWKQILDWHAMSFLFAPF